MLAGSPASHWSRAAHVVHYIPLLVLTQGYYCLSPSVLHRPIIPISRHKEACPHARSGVHPHCASGKIAGVAIMRSMWRTGGETLCLCRDARHAPEEKPCERLSTHPSATSSSPSPAKAAPACLLTRLPATSSPASTPH